MVRSPYPPQGFECLYQDSCPYLDGLSTRWVLGEYRRGEEVYQEHLRIIDHFDGEIKVRDERIRRQERENAELRDKLQALHRRQFKANKHKDAETGGKEVEGASVTGLRNVFRDDAIGDSLKREQALDNAPADDGINFVVPKII